jgi:hypothetical protein
MNSEDSNFIAGRQIRRRKRNSKIWIRVDE